MWSDFGLIGLILAFWSFRGKTIEMRRRWLWWWRRRENNKKWGGGGGGGKTIKMRRRRWRRGETW